MRECRRLAVLVAAGALLAGCGSGSNAAGGPVSTAPVATVEGVGRLPGTAAPTTAPPVPGSPGAPGPTTSTVPVEPLDSRPAEAYVIDYGSGRQIDDPRVLMIGDSVLEATTFRAPDDLDRYVATLGWRIWVDAFRGRHMDQGLDQLEELVAGDAPWDTGWTYPAAPDGRGGVIPEVVVLMLGNNYEGLREQFVRDVDAMLTALAPAKRIVMFTVPLYKPEQADVNEVVRAAAERDDRIVLVDWERLSREWEGVIQGDALHPTDLGASILAQLIARVIGPAPDVPVAVELPVLGRVSDDPLPDWTPPKARETVPELTAPTSRGTDDTTTKSTTKSGTPKPSTPQPTAPEPTSPDPTAPEPTG